jgi:uroporphyrinogen-III decarboxylase
MFTQPEKLLAALDALTPLMINMGIANAQQTGNPLIFIPLHKGGDGFMSDKQYRKFYWPSLQKVILGLIEGGCVPFPAAEGAYNSRLDVIKDIPKGKTIWMFDQTDIIEAKKIVGDTLCIFGNVSAAMLTLSKPEEVRDYTKKLIDNLAPGGGFVLANGVFFDDAKPENLNAMVETGLEYGVY